MIQICKIFRTQDRRSLAGPLQDAVTQQGTQFFFEHDSRHDGHDQKTRQTENGPCRQWPGIGPERPVIPYSPKMFLRWWPRPVISSHGRPGHKAGTSGSLRTSGQRRAQGGETGRRRRPGGRTAAGDHDGKTGTGSERQRPALCSFYSRRRPRRHDRDRPGSDRQRPAPLIAIICAISLLCMLL